MEKTTAGTKTQRRKRTQPRGKPTPKVETISEAEARKNIEKIYELSHFAGKSKHNRLVTRDLNNASNQTTFTKNTKDEIVRYIADPLTYEVQLRNAVRYMYNASTHFYRLIKYFSSLTDWAYILSPTGYNPLKLKPATVVNAYRKCIAAVDAFNIKTQFTDILTVCLREDVYYGTIWETDCSKIIQQLDSDFCKISVIEDGVFNVSFDFSYFDARQDMIDYFPKEFQKKYRKYQSDRTLRWQELDAPTSFAIKCNTDIPEYAIPPFVGILRELFDLEDYKGLKLTKTALSNYSILAMTLPMSKDGEYLMDLDRAKAFYYNLDNVLPEEVGSVLTPMDMKQFDFDKSHTGDTNDIADAEQRLFTAAGVSSLLFNNEKASANALALSIKVDQQLTFGIVRSLEKMLNRYLHYSSFDKFSVTILDVSVFNRKEMGDQYLKACQYGLPMVSMYAASQGLSQADIDTMAFLENDVLELKSKLTPLMSSNTLSNSGSATSTTTKSNDGEVGQGRPEGDLGEVSDSAIQNREDGDDW